MENWKKIPVDRLKDYEVSDLGRIRNSKTLKVLKLCQAWSGHMFLRVTVNNDKYNYKVHRLVMFAFFGIPSDNEVVNHINNIPYDNRLENLEYVTQVQNSNRTKNNKVRGLKIRELYESRKWDSAEEFYKEMLKTVY